MKLSSIALFFTVSLGACTLPSDGQGGRRVENNIYSAQIGIVNHTERFIYSARVGGGGGGHANGLSAGVANVCCASLPVKWYPGLKLEVAWDMPEGAKDIWKTRIVDVEEYETPGSIYLHFFPDDKVRIVVTKWAGWSSKHPIIPPSDFEHPPKNRTKN